MKSGIQSLLLLVFVQLSHEVIEWDFHQDSVSAVQEDTATLKWRVEFTENGESWFSAIINRKPSSEVNFSPMIRKLKNLADGSVKKTVFLTSRAADMSLNISSVSNKANVTFILRNLNSTTDDMLYQLILATSFGSGDSKVTALYIQVRVHNFKGPKNESVNELEEINVRCFADGKPPPTLTIGFPNGDMINGTQTLNHNITAYRNMTGMYNCTAENEATAPQTKSAWINVWFKPESTSINISPDQTGFCLGSLVTISCTSHAKPPANYSLYHNTKLVHHDSTSGVFNVTLNDEGKNNYTCVPYNNVGFGQNQSLELLVKEPPAIGDCKVNSSTMIDGAVVEGKNVTLSCNITGSEPLNTSWTNGSHVWNKRILTFTPVNRVHDGYYHIRLNNGKECYEAEGKNLTLTVYYTPDQTRFINLPSFVCLNRWINLTCKANGHPSNISYTFKNGSTVLGSNRHGSLQIIGSQAGVMDLSCTPSNAIGTGQVATRQVRVMGPLDKTCKIGNETITNKTVEEGSEVVLLLTSSGMDRLDFTWKNKTVEIPGEIGYNVTIKWISRYQGGQYQVVARDRFNCSADMKCNFTLNVQFPASCILHQGLNNHSGEHVVTINISTTGNPPVYEYNWTHPNGSRLTANSRLTFTASRNDFGIYKVSVYNGIGDRGYCTSNVTVQYPPSKVTIIPSRRQFILNEGKSLSLHCKSDSNPPPTYTWKHDGVTLTDGKNGRLVFDKINRRQNGTYRCEAKNHLGSILSDPIEITVQYIDQMKVLGSINQSYSQSNPLVLFNLSVTAYPSNTSLSCNPSAPNILTVITSHDAGLNTKQYLVVVIIKNTVDSGSIVCKAENSVGEREKTLHFYRRPILFKETFGGEFRITNQQWQDDFKDPKSASYTNLEKKCINILQDAFKATSYLAATKIKRFLKGSIIVQFKLEIIGQVLDPLEPLRDYIKRQDGEIQGLQIDHKSIQKSRDLENTLPSPTVGANKEDDKTLVAVLGVLFALSIVLNIIFIVGFLWLRRKDSKGNSGKRSNNNDERGQINDISLQETSFNGTPNVPEYEPIRRRGLASSNAGIPEYEAVATRTQASQPHDSIPQYESAEHHVQTGAVSNTPPVTYQTIQPRTGNYGSLNPLTRLPPKDASTGSPTGTGQYQTLQHKGVSPQYQSLDDLSRC